MNKGNPRQAQLHLFSRDSSAKFRIRSASGHKNKSNVSSENHNQKPSAHDQSDNKKPNQSICKQISNLRTGQKNPQRSSSEQKHFRRQKRVASLVYLKKRKGDGNEMRKNSHTQYTVRLFYPTQVTEADRQQTEQAHKPEEGNRRKIVNKKIRLKQFMRDSGTQTNCNGEQEYWNEVQESLILPELLNEEEPSVEFVKLYQNLMSE